MPTINKGKKKTNKYQKHNKNVDISKIYNSPNWKKLRLGYLMQHPLCEQCLKEDKITPATEVHHIKPISTGSDELAMKSIAYNAYNLMALCKDCHHKIHKQMKDKKN